MCVCVCDVYNVWLQVVSLPFGYCSKKLATFSINSWWSISNSQTLAHVHPPNCQRHLNDVSSKQTAPLFMFIYMLEVTINGFMDTGELPYSIHAIDVYVSAAAHLAYVTPGNSSCNCHYTCFTASLLFLGRFQEGLNENLSWLQDRLAG